MSDNKKYYYLKLKDNFYDSEEMIILQNMQDGYLYSDILMKLYLRSLKNRGKLMFKDRIPYTPDVLAQVVRHNVGVVKEALDKFRLLGLVEILDTGEIFMNDIQNFIGASSTEADRKREYRNKIDNLKLVSGQMSDKNPPKKEIEIELDIELKRDKELKIDYKTIMESWNFLGIGNIKSVTDKRKKHLQARIKKFSYEEVLKCIEIIKECSFLKGENNRKWKATFDWVFQNENNFIKVLEGNYKDKETDDYSQFETKI